MVFVDRYALEVPLGESEAGTVWAAKETANGRRVVIAVLDEDAPGALKERLVAVGNALRGFSHPNVVRVLDVGTSEEGAPYVVMERLEGASLAQRWEASPSLRADRTLEIGIGIVDGLTKLHELTLPDGQPLVHGDIEPGNVLLVGAPGREIPKLVGFVLNRSAVRADVSARASLSSLEPIAYAAPEQASGAVTSSPGADLYSAAAIVFAGLTGRPPHIGADAGALAEAIARDPVPLFITLRKDLTPFAATLDRALASDPARRYADGGALGRALRTALAMGRTLGSKETPIGKRSALPGQGASTASIPGSTRAPSRSPTPVRSTGRGLSPPTRTDAAARAEASERATNASEVKTQSSAQTTEARRTTKSSEDARESTAEATKSPEETTGATSGDAAQASEEAAKASEEPAKASEEAAQASEEPAKASEEAAQASEEPAKASEEPAKASEEPAKVSEEVAQASEEAAQASEEPAKASEEPAKASEEAAQASEEPAKAADEPAKALDDVDGVASGELELVSAEIPLPPAHPPEPDSSRVFSAEPPEPRPAPPVPSAPPRAAQLDSEPARAASEVEPAALPTQPEPGAAAAPEAQDDLNGPPRWLLVALVATVALLGAIFAWMRFGLAPAQEPTASLGAILDDEGQHALQPPREPGSSASHDEPRATGAADSGPSEQGLPSEEVLPFAQDAADPSPAEPREAAGEPRRTAGLDAADTTGRQAVGQTMTGRQTTTRAQTTRPLATGGMRTGEGTMGRSRTTVVTDPGF
ncbi:MAG: protein kinase domain-containing protein [Deltaproteobacteria bacterium]